MRLYRDVTLCRALELSSTDYIRLRRISRIDPFLRPDAALVFCDLVEMVRASGFDIATLAYLMLHELIQQRPSC